ncbi:hypothetical protein K505DRAFT_313453 [Melanomma pulvis-pyrius CBS 109.77]|uniref:Uncharacterized protein n=1 Tax=Melanomma pulvis-pyrius CBS 109.77 TaxID=1314802 RepID=A0A6A6WZB7_9PLEO|nr:hypothetical protein K505DRAFT_313453 [Melanomma pulvis-pyrius CBS 109.77]
MDLLAANDQENLAHNLHAGAAGKSLNAGLKGFNAKTPGNKAPKTPFKIPLNDENAVFKAGKSAMKTNGKGNENLFMTMKKGGKLDDNAFVTPAGPRTRAPLGMKTTNAKARAFQTPAPLSGSAKTQKISPRLRRPKVKIHQPEAQNEEEDDVPEVEYMPPKEIPLADETENLPADWKFPMFEGTNMTRGVYSAYVNPVEDDGRTRKEREFEEGLARDRKKRDEEFDKIFAETMAQDEAEARRRLGIESPKKAAPKGGLPPKKRVPGPSTLKSKSAAAALSPAPKPTYNPPIAITKSRVPASLLPGRRPAKPLMNPSTSRHAAANAASKSTIGYAQGRSSVTSPRKPLSNVMKPAPFSTTSRQPTAISSIHNPNASVTSTSSKRTFSRSSSNATLVAPSQENDSYQTAEDIEREMQFLLLQDDPDDEEVDAWMNNFNTQLGGDGLDDEFADFQLQLPESL